MSCGCIQREKTAARSVTHGHTRGGVTSDTYRSWQNAKLRCEDPKNISYKNYGARGVRMHPAWSRSFARFLADVGPRPVGTSIDRIDNDKGYVPGNVRWATRAEQDANRRPRRERK